MLQDHRYSHVSAFARLGFSNRIGACLARAAKSRWSVARAPWPIVAELLDQARATLDLADDATIAALHLHNPDVIRIATSADGARRGLLAVLPLNRAGGQALIDGQLDGRAPKVEWICEPNEDPHALYVWLVFMPGTFGATLDAIAQAIDPMLRSGCALFSRAANAHSERLHEHAGFVPAELYYPGCRPGLRVVFPEQKMATAPQRISDIRVARSIEDIMQVFTVRAATYIAEQFCFYAEEFDGNDFCATHFIGRIDGDAAGCVRLRFFDGFAKLERLAVRAEYRNSRLAYQLVRAALDHCARKGYRRIYGHSRIDLVRFWRVFGFRPIESRATFAFANVNYAEILLEQPIHPEAVRLGDDPMRMLRPEGSWDEPGPFDLPGSAADPRRARMIEERTRTVNGTKIAP